jgi:hypothetical protein
MNNKSKKVCQKKIKESDTSTAAYAYKKIKTPACYECSKPDMKIEQSSTKRSKPRNQN